MINVEALLAVFRDVRVLVDKPDNDFTWTSWIDRESATREIDGFLAKLEARESMPIASMNTVFAPTGPLQELAISSGWGEEYLALADRFEEALGCPCGWSQCTAEPTYLGIDDAGFEVSEQTCERCGEARVRLFREDEGFSGSGRWYEGTVPAGTSVTQENARALVESLGGYQFGGSYYDGKTGWATGPIR
ncbi:hypothetical protein EON81_28680 [bacterium]|nr:MAG: hypothetical protein EON81_28680 [bacterium]